MSDAIHPAAAGGFGRSADAYERGGPGYPDEAVDLLVAALPGRRVIDLAAGTGKLTRALVARVTLSPRRRAELVLQIP